MTRVQPKSKSQINLKKLSISPRCAYFQYLNHRSQSTSEINKNVTVSYERFLITILCRCNFIYSFFSFSHFTTGTRYQ